MTKMHFSDFKEELNEKVRNVLIERGFSLEEALSLDDMNKVECYDKGVNDAIDMVIRFMLSKCGYIDEQS
jgi:hypothetical protein